MRFPSARKGVRTIFVGVLIELIVAISSIVVSVLVTFPETNTYGTTLYFVNSTIAALAAISAIAAFILEIVGLFQAKADDKSFAYALWVILISVIATIVSFSLSFINQPWSKDAIVIIDTVSGVAGLIVVMYILTGISNLTEKLNENSFAKSGRILRVIIGILFLIALALNLIANFIRVSPEGIKIMGYVAIGAGGVQLVAYIWYFIYLARAPKKLSK